MQSLQKNNNLEWLAKREVVTTWKHLARTTICKSFKRIVLDLNSQRTFQKNNLQKIGYNNNNSARFIKKINSEFDLFWLCYFHPFNNITYHYTKYIILEFSSTSDLSANALAKSASYWSPGVSWGIILQVPLLARVASECLISLRFRHW